MTEMLDLVHTGENLQQRELAEVIARVVLLHMQKMIKPGDVSVDHHTLAQASKDYAWETMFKNNRFQVDINSAISELAEEYVR